MGWTWAETKNAINQQKHKLSFETASLVFADPLAASRPDLFPGEERWQTIGMIGNVVILVVHTQLEMDETTGKETGRMISARKATPQERKMYEKGDF